jgi:hypothetical protein
MQPAKKSAWFYPTFFAAIMLLFIGILVYVYHESKLANPVMLDEKGSPR